MLRFNKDKIDINIDLDSLNKSLIPLLIEDEIWKSLFSNIKDKEIINLKEQLKSLVDSSRNVRKELPGKKEEKRKLISKILTLSEKVNNNELVEGVDLLENYKNELEKLNDEIDELNFKSETIPSEVRRINLELLIETIKYAYIDIIDSEESLKDVETELDELRKRLREIIKEKYDYEEKRNEIYKFLHNTLGANEVDRLDRKILD